MKHGRKIIALLPAAGIGKRMGAGINKQYLEVGAVPVLARTLLTVQECSIIDEIIVVIPSDEIPYCSENIVNKYSISKVVKIVAGGAERQNSVYNGLKSISCSDDDIVVIHDGVRPFVTEQIIEATVDFSIDFDGAVSAVPVKDTVKTVSEGVITGTPARSSLWLAQTPQTFRYSVIRSAHEKASEENYLGTDDASLVERVGRRVKIINGDYRNIKLTTPEDLILAEAFLKDDHLPINESVA